VRIVFLGTAGSWPTKERSASAIALDTEKELILLDCGEGTQRQFFQSSVSFMRVRRVFISHFHGDHFLGLPGLIQSMCLNNRTEPLDLYGPPDAKEMFEKVLAMGYFTLRFPVHLHPLRPDESVELPGYTVRTAHADHTVPALAYRVEEDPRRGRFDAPKAHGLGVRGRDFARLEAGETLEINGRTIRPEEVMGPRRTGLSVVYSGDGRPSENVQKLSRRASALIHEATMGEEHEAEANAWGHSSARQAAEIAREAEVGHLFLTHFSSRYKDTAPLADEARSRFGQSVAAHDLLEELLKQP
jgi:ribonuclease Z